ncbi:uncharacterized protein HD556DRAFT_1537998 [Suillus plorans]|uniref:beta-N-acetylhexosaminidase n=1 Tax=Suillus plorans TaxID=116603 RepID=A0A9P7AI57_9AGAM|nr:uncharacterized protein HD556DRAFT_1537998 [Suillus plorans]KAG1789979.1 hypothetical protein HD556DRAFT_1537998 [Suillus plorans]
MGRNWNITLSNETIVICCSSGRKGFQDHPNTIKLLLLEHDVIMSLLSYYPSLLELAYTFDPLANLTEAQYELVPGGEQILWSEQSGPQNVDSIMWPRAASSAEIFWSGKQPTGAALTSPKHFLVCMTSGTGWYSAASMPSILLQPQWCAFRPDPCDILHRCLQDVYSSRSPKTDLYREICASALQEVTRQKWKLTKCSSDGCTEQ